MKKTYLSFFLVPLVTIPGWLRRTRVAAAALCALLLGGMLMQAAPVELAPADSPVDNPLKGLVPYVNHKGSFPHSMEFNYLPLKKLMTGPDTFDWQPLDRLLEDVASRGNHTVFRVWVEYPGRPSGLPDYLREQGVKITEWSNWEEPGQKVCYTPDYEDERLVSALEHFIAALGKRYDGDPRVAYITAGLLGSWGEWHTWPRDELFASLRTQRRVMDAYEQAFVKTPILLRYPTGTNDARHAANASRPMGYHDDSFAWDTLDMGAVDESCFLRRMKGAGEAALDKWRTEPIGGEIRPEAWGQVFDPKPENTNVQDFAECVRQTHVTWLMDSGMFRGQTNAARYERAVQQVRGMGYDFYVRSADITRDGSKVSLRLSVINQGVAPFYQDWKMELAALTDDGGVAQRWPVDWKLTALQPGDPARVWEAVIDVGGLAPQAHTLVLRAINPLPGGKALRFANADQDRNAKGWLSVGSVP